MRLLTLVRLDTYANAPASQLSFGQRRLLEIVSTFITKPGSSCLTSLPLASILRCWPYWAIL